MNRRRFLTEGLFVGGGLLASVAWGLLTRPAIPQDILARPPLRKVRSTADPVGVKTPDPPMPGQMHLAGDVAAPPKSGPVQR